jgi:hypothetical protein
MLNGFRRAWPQWGARLAGGPHPRHPAATPPISRPARRSALASNQAVLEAVYAKDGQLQRVEFTEVFEALFSRPSSNRGHGGPNGI